ncbi:flagellar basal-body MS-ring/collar protein FliF [Paenibacillus sp. GCM10012307]|uniref:Flagellar M-ring protein n=1 Tax=Paenibacillus roseus TaxID=2798579 RepID=A0A934J5R7_9BACL|nr:flagellar M-ring protein FliF [Paenibacillus roseus]
MNEKVTQYRDRITQYWKQLSRTRRMLFGATFGFFIISIVLLVLIFSRTEYELVFQDLDAADAASITQYLESNKIEYKLGSGGTTISVPAASAAKVRVDIGSQGLVQNGSIGFDAFGQGSSAFGRTDNEFNVMYRNALNGEIQRMLNSMQGIQKSNVLINLPEESVFINANGKEPSSASVVLTFKPGYRPTQEAIDGYYNLVKTAIPNLAIEDITISSQQSELFASSKLTGNGMVAQPVDTQFQIERKFKEEVRKSIKEFLGRFYGADKVVISVAATLNFDQKNSTQTLVQPLENNDNRGIIISETESSRSSTGADAPAGGVVGTGETDVPGYQGTDGRTSSSDEASRTTNYDISRITNNIVSGPFVVKDLSVSVGIEAAQLTDEQRQEISNYLIPFVRAQLSDSGQNINDDVLMAKKVSIFAQSYVGSEETTAASGLSWPWLAGIGLAALLVGGGVVYLINRRRNQVNFEEEELLEQPKVEYPTIDLDIETNESQVRKQLEQLAKRKPEEFVNLLRTWLVDE